MGIDDRLTDVDAITGPFVDDEELSERIDIDPDDLGDQYFLSGFWGGAEQETQTFVLSLHDIEFLQLHPVFQLACLQGAVFFDQVVMRGEYLVGPVIETNR